MNPLVGLARPLAALAEDAKIRLAAGRAEEYLQRFDLDEHYARIVAGTDRRITEIRERPGAAVYAPAPPRATHGADKGPEFPGAPAPRLRGVEGQPS